MDEFTLSEAMEAVDEYLTEAEKTFYAADTGYKMTDDYNENKKVRNLGKDTLSSPNDRQNKSINESVTELKLQVYEAFDEGLIDVEEKENMLNLLDLDNYEIEE